MKHTVAAIQLASGPNLQGNLNQVARLLGEAARAGAKLIVLPENFAFMGNQETDKLAIAESPGEGPIQLFLAKHARELGVWIIGGTIPMLANDSSHVFASALVYDAQGELVSRYDKCHLFDVRLTESNETYLESQTVAAGDTAVWFDSPFGRIGLAICYDLRFPEMFRVLMEHQVEILAIPSAFTATTGRAHWEVLLRARAIENLCYVIAPNQGGFHVNGRETYGDSMIINPWGEVQQRLASGAGFVLADIDLAKQATLRTTFPVLQHQRFRCAAT